jgi:hypothetical protein
MVNLLNKCYSNLLVYMHFLTETKIFDYMKYNWDIEWLLVFNFFFNTDVISSSTLTGFSPLLGAIRPWMLRDSERRSQLLPKLTQLVPINPGHSPDDIIRCCTGTFTVVDRSMGSLSSNLSRLSTGTSPPSVMGSSCSLCLFLQDYFELYFPRVHRIGLLQATGSSQKYFH